MTIRHATPPLLIVMLFAEFVCFIPSSSNSQQEHASRAHSDQPVQIVQNAAALQSTPKEDETTSQPEVSGAQATGVAGGPDASGPIAPQRQGETSINLTVPVPWDKRSPTWVLKATANSAIVVQDSRGGNRDIQVVEFAGDHAHFVGKNGHGITGLEGTLLNVAARSPDGRLWVVAERSRFPNQIQGNQFCLYVLENDNWNPVGPRFGAPREHAWNYEEHGLHFFEDSRPVTVSIRANRNGDKSSWQLRLRRLEGDRWVTLPGHEYIYDRTSHLRLVWRANDAWLFQVREKSGRTTLDVRRIKGPRPEEVVGQFHLDSWAGKMCFFHFAVSPDDSIAAVGCQGAIDDIKLDTPFFVKLYHSSGKGVYKQKAVPFPPGAGHAIDIVEWSPTAALHVVRSTHEKIFVHRFADGRWTSVGEGAEPREVGGTIMSPRLYFRDDDCPVVTWEKFIQVD